MLQSTPAPPPVPTLPATATLPAVATLPATATLPAVATLPAIATLPAVARLPATARLPAVARLPATATLPAVALLPAAATLSTVRFLARRTIALLTDQASQMSDCRRIPCMFAEPVACFAAAGESAATGGSLAALRAVIGSRRPKGIFRRRRTSGRHSTMASSWRGGSGRAVNRAHLPRISPLEASSVPLAMGRGWRRAFRHLRTPRLHAGDRSTAGSCSDQITTARQYQRRPRLLRAATPNRPSLFTQRPAHCPNRLGRSGRVAQWESARFTRERSQVRNPPRPLAEEPTKRRILTTRQPSICAPSTRRFQRQCHLVPDPSH